MRLTRLHTSLTLAAGLLACNAHAATITLLHLNDFHARLTPHADWVEDRGHAHVADKGGLARLATLVKQRRAHDPAAVLVNVGDTFHGGAEATFTNGNAVVDPINALGIDVGVPGNWDFAYGPAVTRLRFATQSRFETLALQALAGGPIKRPDYPNLAANLHYAEPSFKAGEPVLPATLMKRVHGVDVGFIGITSDIVADMAAILATGFDFTTGEADLTDLIDTHARALRQHGAEIVVVLSELGLHKDYRLADRVAPGSVDVFFSGHTHELTRTPLISKSGARVVESGNDGFLGEMTIEVEANQRPTFAWALHEIDASVPEDPAMKARVAAARAPFLADNPNLKLPQPGSQLTLNQAIDTPVGPTLETLHRKNSLESPFSAVWGEVLRDYAGTQLSLSPGFRLDATVPGANENYEDAHLVRGQITLEDVYRFFPMPLTLATGTVTAPELKKILEGRLQATFALDSFAQRGGYHDSWGGLRARTDLGAAPGSRIQGIALADGSQVTSASTLSVAGCRRPVDRDTVTLCSYPVFGEVADLINPATGKAWAVQDLFVKLAGEGRFNQPARVHFINVGGTPLWPAQPFVEPLAVDVGAAASVRVVAVGPGPDGATRVTLEIRNETAQAIGLPLKLEVTQAVLVNPQGQRYNAPFVKLAQPIPAFGSTRIAVDLLTTPAVARFAVVSGGV